MLILFFLGVNSGGVGILCCQGSIMDQQVDVIGVPEVVIQVLLDTKLQQHALDFHAQNSIIFP